MIATIPKPKRLEVVKSPSMTESSSSDGEIAGAAHPDHHSAFLASPIQTQALMTILNCLLLHMASLVAGRGDQLTQHSGSFVEGTKATLRGHFDRVSGVLDPQVETTRLQVIGDALKSRS